MKIIGNNYYFTAKGSCFFLLKEGNSHVESRSHLKTEGLMECCCKVRAGAQHPLPVTRVDLQ